MSSERGSALDTRAFEHVALVHSTPEGLLPPATRFVEEGVSAGHAVCAIFEPRALSELSAAVGPTANVTFVDVNEYPTPAARLRGVHRFVTDALDNGAMHVRLIGQAMWPTSLEHAREWGRYESVVNDVLRPFPVSATCTYDASRLPRGVLADADLTHPLVTDGVARRRSSDYVQPAALLPRWNTQPRPVPASAAAMTPPFDPASTRRFISDRSAAAGLSDERAKDLALAATEILTNAIEHGGGVRSVRTWVADGHLECQIDDMGRGPTDPLAGYRPPTTEQPTGRGLWLARQMVDLMRIVPGPAGTSVRLSVAIA